MALSKYAPGSYKEILSISTPLMFSYFFGLMLFFVDRSFLAHYSQADFNAGVSGGILFWTFIDGAILLATMAEVFVAQFNGAKQTDKLASPIWQMIWFSLATALFYIPVGMWGSSYIYSTFYPPSADAHLAQVYFQWLMLFGPMFPMAAALTAFYLGRGKTKVMIWLGLLTNIVNFVLDWVLIFGVEGIFKGRGAEGAAIATGLSQVFQVAFLAFLFFRKEEREQFGTHKATFDFSLMKQTLRIGVTPAFAITLDLFGFSIYYILMRQVSIDYMTIAGIFQTLLILFSFYGESLMKGLTAVIGNMIGAKDWKKIPQSLFKSCHLYLVFCALAFVPLVLFSDTIANLFLSGKSWASDVESSLDSNMTLADIKDTISISMKYLWFYLVFKGISWQISGALVAAGDTLFLALISPLCTWGAFLAPIYIFVIVPKGSIETAMLINVIYGICICTAYALRFYTGKWKEKRLIDF